MAPQGVAQCFGLNWTRRNRKSASSHDFQRGFPPGDSDGLGIHPCYPADPPGTPSPSCREIPSPHVTEPAAPSDFRPNHSFRLVLLPFLHWAAIAARSLGEFEYSRANEAHQRMNYVERIESLLHPDLTGTIAALDLFAGCGGLALGFEAQGFRTVGYEKDADACETYRRNLKRACHQVTLTPETVFSKTDVVIGGPPCQPFSVGGHQMGLKDSRDGFPIFLAAIKQVQPEIWLFENVRGLLYSNRWYFDQILEALKSLNYVIEVRLLNAVNYGVPQNRERVIVVGHRGEFQFPKESPGKVTVSDALGE